jgi:hypothetical protein
LPAQFFILHKSTFLCPTFGVHIILWKKLQKGFFIKVGLKARERFIQEEVCFKMPTSSWPSPLQRTASHIRRKHFCNFPERLNNMASNAMAESYMTALRSFVSAPGPALNKD